jgi:hypothetical protein
MTNDHKESGASQSLRAPFTFITNNNSKTIHSKMEITNKLTKTKLMRYESKI